MLITTTRWTGPTCCWKTVAMAGEWTAAGTATGRAVLMVPVGAVAMRRRAGGCSWRSRGSREPRDGLGGDSQHLLRFGHSTSYPPSFWSQHSFVLVTTFLSCWRTCSIIKHAWANLPPADGRKARRVKIHGGEYRTPTGVLAFTLNKHTFLMRLNKQTFFKTFWPEFNVYML